MEDEIKTVEESQKVTQEAPKKRGRKPKTDDAVNLEPSVKEEVKEASKDEEQHAVQPAPDPGVQELESEVESNHIQEAESVVIETKNEVEPIETSSKICSAVVKNIRVYKTPNEKTYATSISGSIRYIGEAVNGFVPVEFKLPGQGRLFKGFVKLQDI